MKMTLIAIVMFFYTHSVYAQDILINGVTLVSKKRILKNEYNTHDTMLTIVAVQKGQNTVLKKFYLYKDEGADCNNTFWNTGKIQIAHDSLILLTHYCQKLQDPIPEWRKEIYKVSKTGSLVLVYDRTRDHNEKIWRITDAKK